MSDFTAAVPVSGRVKIASAPYTPGRLRSASTIPIKRTDNPREFFVKSRSRKDHWWPVNLDGDPMCYCEDNENTTRQCAHVLAARLASGDLSLLQPLGKMLVDAEARNAELTRTTARRPRRERGRANG